MTPANAAPVLTPARLLSIYLSKATLSWGCSLSHFPYILIGKWSEDGESGRRFLLVFDSLGDVANLRLTHPTRSLL